MWHVQSSQPLVLLAAISVCLCPYISCNTVIPLGYGPPNSPAVPYGYGPPNSPANLLTSEAAQPPQSASAGQSDLEYIQLETIQPYLNSTYPPLPETFLVVNFTYRFIGDNLTYPNATFKTTITNAFVALAVSKADLQIGITYRAGVEAPILGPDGKSGLAYAPTPGMVPENFGRKLLQGGTQMFDKASFDNRDTIYESIDVEFLATGTGASSAINVFRPTVLNGYITTLFAQQGINLAAVPINISTSYTLLPVTEKMGFSPAYVLGSILRFSGSGFFPENTQDQSMLLLALNGIFGSQTAFMYNRIQSAWQDSAHGTVRIAMLTYTNQLVQSIDDIAGGAGSLSSMWGQMVAQAGANISLTVLSSAPLGTQAQELTGDPAFNLNLTAMPTTTSQSEKSGSGGMSGKDVAAVVVGCSAGVAILIAAVVYFLNRRLYSRTLSGNAFSSMAPSEAKGDPKFLSTDIFDSKCGTGGGGDGSSSGEIEAIQPVVHPLSDAWNIDPSELAVCELADGKDWLLGTGSFGHVYRGLRGGVQEVAIKQLVSPGSLHLRMFEKEVAMLRHLNFDRNLVQFLGACIAEDNLMLVLEYMAGGDLRDALGDDHHGKFGWYGKGARIMVDIARGLHFLHNNNVIHRDLKTKNILLTARGEAKIGDVGLAKLLGSQLLSTQINAAGTFAYAAPELLLGETCDQSADIYSFGVIMWEVVTHEIPIRGNLRDAEVPREAPAEIAALIEACLQRNAKARPTAKQIFDFLLDVLSRPQSNLPPLLETTETQKAETPTAELAAGQDSIFLTAEDIGEGNPPGDKSANPGGKAPANKAAQQQ